MRPVFLHCMLGLAVLGPIQGSRLERLEDDVNSLKRFIFKELVFIRDEVKEISNRVEVLENDTQKPSAHIQDRQSFEDRIRGEDNKPNLIVVSEVENIRKAFKNEKNDLHKLKTDAQGQLMDLEKKIDTHLESLTSEVQTHIKYIHKNITLANASLLNIINTSTANVSIFSDNLRKELVEFNANTSEQLSLRFNETEGKMKQNITTTYRHNEDKQQSFMALADRNISEIMLKAENIISLIRTNFSEVPTQITNLSLEIHSVKQIVHFAEEKITNDLESSSSYLQKQITTLIACSDALSSHNGSIQCDYYYPVTKNIRLANASPYRSTGVQGRLEVRHNVEWGTVCDDSFHFDKYPIENNVNVVCKTFGFRECEYVLKAGLGGGSGPIWMDDVKCGGEESSFLDCPHSGWGVGNCGHDEDVGFRMWN